MKHITFLHTVHKFKTLIGPLFTSKSAVLAGNIRVEGSLCNRAKLDNISIIYQARYRD